MTLEDVERNNLEIVYKHYHNENWERGQGVWLVNSILITGSLIVGFQSFQLGAFEFPTALVSLVLIIIANFNQVTSDRVTSITYDTMQKIEEKLEISKLEELAPRRMYESKIRKSKWYPVRSITPYFLYDFLIGCYLFVLFNKLSSSIIINIELSFLVFIIIFRINFGIQNQHKITDGIAQKKENREKIMMFLLFWKR